MKTKQRAVIGLLTALIAISIAFTACGGDDDDGKYKPGEIVGEGTSANPYHVHDVITLSSVGKTPVGYNGWTLDAHYKQTANIDLNTVTNWTPIGTFIGPISEENEPFTGSYDGSSYTIKNLKIINATTFGQGLFGFVGEDGIVKNIGIIDCDITSNNYGTGGLVGVNFGGTVSNCYVTGNVLGTGYVGGVVGCNDDGIVSNCYATGNVSGTSSVGGVVGYNYSGTVSNSVALNSSITRISGTSNDFARVSCSGSNINNYARDDMKFIDEDGNSSSTFPTSSVIYNGTDITSTQWSSSTWWTGTAGWDASIWDFSNISATSFPKLK